MSGVKGRSGPRKSKGRQYDDWVKENPGKIVELLESLYEAGVKGEREAAIYVIDRILGRPRQAQDVNLTGKMLVMTPDTLELANRRLIEIKEEETKLIEEYNATEQGKG